jgi:Fe-S oxidoreductase
MTEAIQLGKKKHGIQTDLEIAPMVRYYARWLREGKLEVSADWNKDLKIKLTVQDPCQQVRKSFGDPLAEDLREVVKACIGAENFVDMIPNRSNNFCCGGGGGYLQSGYTEARRQYGRIKFDQVMATKASYVVTPCHNCHAQIHDLGEHFNGGYHVIHLWTLIGLALGILAENEREYLGADLKEVNLPRD